MLTVCCAVFQAPAAIVDSLSGYDSDRVGWSVSLSAGISASGGNTELLEAEGGARLQWQGARDRFRLLGGYARQTSESREIAEDAMLHLRHNRRIAGRLHSLAFAQLQRNPFQRLAARTLFGLGGRVDLWKETSGESALGVAHMIEIEELEGAAGEETVQRLSSFLAIRWKWTENASVLTTVFVQPLWSDMSDLRASGSATLSVRITERVGLEFSGGFQHDSRPPELVEETDWNSGTAFRFEI